MALYHMFDSVGFKNAFGLWGDITPGMKEAGASDLSGHTILGMGFGFLLNRHPFKLTISIKITEQR